MSAPIRHGGGITEAARLYGGQPEDWLDLSTGINPCPPSLPSISIDAWHRLPDRHLSDSARDAAADLYRCRPCLPLPVPGTQSAIQHLPKLLAPGRRVAIFGPTYGEYARVFQAAGFGVDQIAEPGALRPDHGLAIVVNPNNPTGRIFRRETLRAVHARMASQAGILLVDEAFGDMQPDASMAQDAAGGEGLIVFRSFGKFFGLAGLRLGFVIAVPDVLDRFADWLGPWAVSGPALSVAEALMRGDRERIAASIVERKTALDGILSAAGLPVAGGTALFSLVEHPRTGDLHAALLKHRILTRAFDYAPDWLRIGLAPDEAADRRLAEALSDAGVR